MKALLHRQNLEEVLLLTNLAACHCPIVYPCSLLVATLLFSLRVAGPMRPSIVSPISSDSALSSGRALATGGGVESAGLGMELVTANPLRAEPLAVHPGLHVDHTGRLYDGSPLQRAVSFAKAPTLAACRTPVFVRFDGPRFWKIFLYHALFPLSLPMIVLLDGVQTAVNMGFLASPVSDPVGIFTW